MYWTKGGVCLRQHFLVWQHRKQCKKMLQFVKILPFPTHRHADGGSGDILSSARRFLKPLETKPAMSVNTSENKHPAPCAVSSNCPHDLALHFSLSLSLSKLRHSDLLARKDPPLPPKTRAEVPLSLGTDQLPAVWKVFSVHLDLLEPCTATWLLWQWTRCRHLDRKWADFLQRVASSHHLIFLFFLFTTWAQHHRRLPLKCVISWNSICETPERMQGLENVTSATTDREIITFFLLSRELSL